MAKTRSRWRAQADRIVGRVLASIPDATVQEKRDALRSSYPWGERKHLPYKHWCAAVREALNLPRKQAPSITLPRARTARDDTVDALLMALAQNPTDVLLVLAIADRLEEIGWTASAASVRKMAKWIPPVEDVARRLWPGSHCVHVTSRGANRVEIQSRHGKRLGLYRDLKDQINGRSLLIDPAVTEAVIIERAAAVLRRFGKEPAHA